MVRPSERTQSPAMTTDTTTFDIESDPTVRASKEFVRQKDEINRRYRGQARKARLMIADLTYGLALIEGNLGVESVRDNWRKHIDRLWRCTRSEETIAREHLLMAIDWAAHCYIDEHRFASRWKNPREVRRVFFATDRNGIDHYHTMGVPHADEGIAFLAKFDPELAARVGVAEIASLIPLWLDRKKNVGRRGKAEGLDAAICTLLKQLGYGQIEPEAIRRQRLAFEKKYPTTPRAPRTRAA